MQGRSEGEEKGHKISIHGRDCIHRWVLLGASIDISSYITEFQSAGLQYTLYF